MNRYFVACCYLSVCFFFACTSSSPDSSPLTATDSQDFASSKQNAPSEIMDSDVFSSASPLQKAQYYYNAARQKLQDKDSTEAIAALERAIHTAPYFLPATNLLAIIYAEKGNAKSLLLLKKVLRASKNKNTQAQAYYYQGIYYKQKKMPSQAIQMWNKSILTDWTFLNPYLEKGVYYLKTKDIASAKKAFQLAYRVNNHNPEVYYWLGRIAESEGNEKNAAACYQNTLLLDPSFKAAKKRLNHLLKATENTP